MGRLKAALRLEWRVRPEQQQVAGPALLSLSAPSPTDLAESECDHASHFDVRVLQRRCQRVEIALASPI
jgi:hypothetical protein